MASDNNYQKTLFEGMICHTSIVDNDKRDQFLNDHPLYLVPILSHILIIFSLLQNTVPKETIHLNVADNFLLSISSCICCSSDLGATGGFTKGTMHTIDATLKKCKNHAVSTTNLPLFITNIIIC